MTNLKELIESEIYPAIFQDPKRAFPEHEFIKYAGGWRSQAYLFGEKHANRRDKTVIKKESIRYIREQGGDPKSIWDYIQERDGLTNQQTLLKLAEVAGIALPNNLSEDELKKIQEANREAKIWEDANTFFIDCLSKDESQIAQSARADHVRTYLVKDRRFAVQFLRLPNNNLNKEAPKMELGFMPGYPELLAYLIKEREHAEDDVRSLIKNNDNRIGTTHILSIPYRDPSGKIRGFVFRSLTNDKPKYLYSEGLKKDDILFNLSARGGKKDVIIVESQLDALLATATGIPDVVALGGTTLNRKQVELLIKFKANKITLALDNDLPGTDGKRAGHEATLKAINILSDFDIPVYVAIYPDGIKDADQLIKERSVEDFQRMIDAAVTAYDFQLNETLIKYSALHRASGLEIMPDKLRDDLIEEVTSQAGKLIPLHAGYLLNTFLSDPGVVGLGIDRQAIEDKAEVLRAQRATTQQADSINSLISEAGNIAKEGSPLEAIGFIESKLPAIKAHDSKAKFKSLLAQDTSEDAVRSRLKNVPDGINTGYTIKIEREVLPIQIPTGVLSFVAAPTNHGKTAFLINTALNIVKNEEYEGRNVYLLTFEESADKVLGYFLNTYINEPLSANPRGSIHYYLRTGSVEMISKEHKDFKEGQLRKTFLSKKDSFFEKYYNTKRIRIIYADFDSDELISLMEHISKVDPGAVILIDYIQKMRMAKKGNMLARNVELKQICEDLETCVNRTQLPILLGAQFNREVTAPWDMHPTKLAEGSDIEKSGGQILGLWNCEKEILLPNKDSKWNKELLQYGLTLGETAPLMILKVLKSRTMRTGDHSLLGYTGSSGLILPQIVYSDTSRELMAQTEGNGGTVKNHKNVPARP